ncbi:MAG TPA: SgcJ/EcaC family oxidoreductase [Chthoniobacterales bacterium]|jgi:hypothetical protein
MDVAQLNDFAARYTAAWCSQDPDRVASFYAENGSLTINKGTSSTGRAAIAAAAQDFFKTFPDLVVKMDRFDVLDGDPHLNPLPEGEAEEEKSIKSAVYHWTLVGTNTGPEGTGNAVRISGYEQWRLSPDGLIAESKGHFDEADYQRQLKGG